MTQTSTPTPHEAAVIEDQNQETTDAKVRGNSQVQRAGIAKAAVSIGSNRAFPCGGSETRVCGTQSRDLLT